MISKLLSLKALGIALPAMALTAGSAAAATGSLPSPAQSAVSHALSDVGIHVPKGHDDTSTPPANAVGPEATGPAKFGLCTAASANGAAQAGAGHHPSSRSVAFSNLEKAAAAAHETISVFCAGATPGSGNTGAGANGSNDSQAPDSGGSKGHSGNAPAGPPSSTPASGTAPVSTPGGPPSSTPASGTAPVSTPARPPASVPVGKP